MKLFSSLLIACLFLIVQTGCSKKNNNTPTEPAETPGEVTAVGVADNSNPSTKVLGVEGGIISSNDGKISVSIPQGALSGNQTISIQRISNTNPMGLHNGYRITPHNIVFTKPVTITFRYTEKDVVGTVPEAFGIAYQNNEGVWKAINSTTVNKNLMLVSVETTHFSDWTFFKSFELTSSAAVLPVNGVAQLELISDANFLLASLEKAERPIGKRQNMTALFIKGWSLAGAGKLSPNQQKATYTAPATVPSAPNPIAISVNIDLNQKGKFVVLTHIKISNDGEISVRVGGGDWFTQEASPVVKLAENYYILADSDGDERGRYITVRWQGAGTGIFAYKSPMVNTGTHVQYLITGGPNYNCAYTTPADEFVASGGGVTITSLGETDGFVTGTFVITPSGTGDFLRAGPTVEGKFRVRKSW